MEDVGPDRYVQHGNGLIGHQEGADGQILQALAGGQVGKLRTSAPDSDSCAGCHNDPEPGGAGDFVGSIGTSVILAIAASFFVQPESRAAYPNADDNEFLVNTAYQNLLERAPEEEGFTYWVDALDSGDVSRPEFMLAIINGARAETGSPEDARVISQKGDIGIEPPLVRIRISGSGISEA